MPYCVLARRGGRGSGAGGRTPRAPDLMKRVVQLGGEVCLQGRVFAENLLSYTPSASQKLLKRPQIKTPAL